MSALSLLSLFPATQQQVIASRKRTFVQWGRGLTETQYLTRDARLDVLEHASNGKLTTWILAPRDNPETLDFRCSCETFKRKCLAKWPGSKESKEVIGYGIASVFTPAENRGKGYGRHMMRLLHWVLAPRNVLPPFPENWGSPPPEIARCGNASFSVLYSDIGYDFYRLAGPDETSEGWVVREPVSTIWEVPQDITTVEVPDESFSIEWLDEEACKAIWTKDVQVMKADMSRSTSEHVQFTYLPDAGVALCMVRRAEFFEYSHSYEVPSKWGIAIHSRDDEKKDVLSAFTTWTLDVRPPPSTLLATRLRATVATFPHLLSHMLLAARESDQDRVEVWNLPKELEETAQRLGGKTGIREEHLNAFKWYGPERSGDVDWLFNEKFCWC